ncbi:hypothetical protein COLO4_34760 [Corchorus olitorius]|uniref:Uncharacterized protein n=1 Tax=Corchorus olitorius TaxID=93759 RepID=A0A1R3GJT7_9ROSI|nr:hypothetical protein COLO4_34760 [Corchorus olitorius]
MDNLIASDACKVASDAMRSATSYLPKLKTGAKVFGTFLGGAVALHWKEILHVTSSGITVKTYVFDNDEEIKKIGENTQLLVSNLDHVKGVKNLNDKKRGFRCGFFSGVQWVFTSKSNRSVMMVFVKRAFK